MDEEIVFNQPDQLSCVNIQKLTQCIELLQKQIISKMAISPNMFLSSITEGIHPPQFEPWYRPKDTSNQQVIKERPSLKMLDIKFDSKVGGFVAHAVSAVDEFGCMTTNPKIDIQEDLL